MTMIFTSCRPSIKQLFLEADNYYKADQYEKALDVCEKIIKKDSTNQLAYYYRGKCYFYLDKNKEALADFNKILSLQPVPNGLTFRLNRNLPYISDKERYKVYYEEALFERAMTEYYMDSFKNAFHDFRDCIGLGYEPKSDCYRYLGIIYIDYRQNDKGCEMLKKAALEGDTAATTLIGKYCK
jgi:tetratricopeptide (TPR) repeat protein